MKTTTLKRQGYLVPECEELMISISKCILDGSGGAGGSIQPGEDDDPIDDD